MPIRGLHRYDRVVYAIQAGNGLIKFGCTRDLRIRIANLQTTSPDEMRCVGWARGGLIEEAALHHRLLDSVHHGEWFMPTTDVLAVVANFGRVVAGLRKRHSQTVSRYRLREVYRAARSLMRSKAKASRLSRTAEVTQ